uniref:Uncharacterized protein n=1 Tax=Hordeum vulgare subsp. vulgare TaxID=112509 RepID=A0A8I6Y7M6_HORVV
MLLPSPRSGSARSTTTRSSRTRCRRSSCRSPWPRRLRPPPASPTAAPPSSHSTGSAPRSSPICPSVLLLLIFAPPYVEEAEGFSPCSSPEGGNARDGQGCLIELVDVFSALDGEVGKRLNDMLPVPVSSHYALHFLLIQDYMSIMTEQLLLVEVIHCIIKGLSALVLGFYSLKGIQSSTSDRYLI